MVTSGWLHMCLILSSTMKALWRQLQKEYPDMTIKGCMDHCLDLFLKDCKDIMQVRLSKPKLLLLLVLPLFYCA